MIEASAPPQLRGFRYESRLGSGGFADVYLYEQELPRRKVAVKVLHSDGLTPATRSAFVAEANVMAQLSAHPYIVSIHHADIADDGRPFLAMEYCSGPNLADRYKAEPFSAAEALRTGIRLAGAVATAHGAGILHRDIKPANVLTNDYGWPALTDFGIASALESEVAPHGTTTRVQLAEQGSTTGSQAIGMSIPWSPPEMFDDDPRPDVRSDVFSLAATVWTLLAGRTPFEVPGRSNQSLDLMSRIERGAVTAMPRDDLPGSLVAVLRKGMAVDPAGRFASAVDLGQALQRVELELGYSPTPLDVPNLTAAVPVRDRSDASPDATRARGVSTVAAQAPTATPAPDATKARPVRRIAPAVTPAAVRTAVEAASAPTAAPVEHTIVRRHAAVLDQPSQGVQAPTAERRRGIVVGILVGLVVVIGVIVAVAIIVPRGAPVATRHTPAAAHALGAGGDIVPAPVLGAVQRSADGTSVTFTWTDPKPEAGDSYVWQRTDGPGGDAQPTQQATATVLGVTAGTTVCLSVAIVRSGELSPDPLKACTP